MENTDQAAQFKVIDMIKDMHVGMLATRGADGHYHARPMAASDTTFDGSLYFLTDVESGKVHDLEHEGEVLVTFADQAKHKYVSLRGRGIILRDRASIRDHWTQEAKPWFPKGPDDPNIALIKVGIEEAEYWDAPSGRMVVFYAYAKAIMTGQRPGVVGDHERVSMR
jgi:general stress protein 26